MALAVAVPAAAEDKAAARAAYAEGSKYYDLNQYALALEAFKRAYWNYEDPVILFNIAQCHRALGHKAEAVGFYRSYLRKASEPRNREEVQKLVSELESAIAQEKAVAAAPPQGTIAADGKPTAAPPAAEASERKPNPPVASPALSLAAAPPAKTEPKPVWKRAWVWGVVGGVLAAGVALGVGLGVGLQSNPPKAVDGVVTF